MSSSSENPSTPKDSSSSSTTSEYVPPKVWSTTEKDNDGGLGGTFGKVNLPTAGPRFEKELAVGKEPLQLYSLGTPNGQKVTILLEELLQAGVTNAGYDAWKISIFADKLDQFGSGFVDLNPNSKIPAMMDYCPKNNNNNDDNDNNNNEPIKIFESGSILFYLAEKYEKFLPNKETNLNKYVQCMNWLFWQMGSAPYVGGGFGHFFAYAPTKMEYPINRFTMETKRQMDVLDKHLANRKYMVGNDDDNDYTIADIAIWSWYGQLALGRGYKGAAEFLNVQSYTNLVRWAKMIDARPAVQRGIAKEHKEMP